MSMHIVGLLFVYTIDMFLPGDKLDCVCLFFTFVKRSFNIQL